MREKDKPGQGQRSPPPPHGRTTAEEGQGWEMLLGFPVTYLFMCRHGHVRAYLCGPPRHMCRSQRTTCGDWVHSSIMRVSETNSGVLVARPLPAKPSLALLLDLMQESYIKNKQTNLYLFQKSHPDLYVQHDWITPGLVSSCYNDVKILLHIINVNNKATGLYTWKA